MGEIFHEVIGPEVTAVLALQVTVVVAMELLRLGFVHRDELLVVIVVIFIADDIDITGNSTVTGLTSDIEMDVGVKSGIALGIDLFELHVFASVIFFFSGLSHTAQTGQQGTSDREGGDELFDGHEDNLPIISVLGLSGSLCRAAVCSNWEDARKE